MAERLTFSKQVDYVLADSWYGSKENMAFIVEKCGTQFIMALKSNRWHPAVRKMKKQQSHFYLAVFAFLLLEKARAAKGKNHFTLMRELNILSAKYGMKAVKKNLHTTLTKLKIAA